MIGDGASEEPEVAVLTPRNERPSANTSSRFAIPFLKRHSSQSFKAPVARKAVKKDREDDAISAKPAAQYYKILYTKRATHKRRKNKSFIDGVLEVRHDMSVILYSEDGKVTAKSRVKGSWDMPSGAEVIVGNWEVEIDCPLSAESFRTGQCFMNEVSKFSPADTYRLPQPKPKAPGFRQPLNTRGPIAQQQLKPQWLHNPEAEGALVLNLSEKGAVPVVVDPYLCRNLRSHQREGVVFLYECVMGIRSASALGAILADEMGLGKTLQVIALLWTLLKQGPQGRPAVKKCVIVTPSSLTENWAAEFRKWLGVERLQVMVLAAGQDAQAQVNVFKHATLYKVLIASYETLRKHAAELTGFCNVLVCDEGHRLKASTGSKTIDALLALKCRRRILLTGTPLQNNLDEFYALVTFVNPDILGSSSSFKTVFAGPISSSQDPSATAEEKRLGSERSRELSRRVDAFLLRRTSAAITKFLPPLSSFVVFCRPSDLQVTLYQSILSSKLVSNLLVSGRSLDALPAITLLRKLCNHPSLLSSDAAAGALPALRQEDRALLSSASPLLSGKLACLESLMGAILGATPDRMVVVCSSVKALDIIQALCETRGWKSVRIDGSTPPGERQDVVTSFNSHGIGQVCLLSTRAGGAGLNLIGANRLVLFDSDWNPAVDLQAMARVWRDGQTKPCAIYRMLTTGTIEEKIYQRQLMKGKLAGVMNPTGAGPAGCFSREQLRELFHLDMTTACNTADLLEGTPGFVDVSCSVTDGPLRAAREESGVSFIYLAPQNAEQPQDEQPVAESPSFGDKGLAKTPLDVGEQPQADLLSKSPSLSMLGGASQLSLDSPYGSESL